MPRGERRQQEEAKEGQDQGNDTGLFSWLASVQRKVLCAHRTILQKEGKREGVASRTHIRYGKTTAFRNVDATQIKFSGSWSARSTLARIVAFELQINEPPSGWMQMPK